MITGTLNGWSEELTATNVVSVDNTGTALALAVGVHGNPAAANQRLDLELTVANTSSTTATGAQLRLQYPTGMGVMNESVFADLTDCLGGVGSTGQCNPGEIACRSLGPLAAGEARSFNIPATTASGLASGASVNWQAWLTADNGDFLAEPRTLRIEAAPALSLISRPRPDCRRRSDELYPVVRVYR